MERGAGWDEIVFLLFGDVAFVGFGWMFLASVAMLGRDTPLPLSRGEVGMLFFFLMVRILVYCFSLLLREVGNCCRNAEYVIKNKGKKNGRGLFFIFVVKE